MKIGNLHLENNIIAAPMAGVTDKAFRILAKEFGVGLVFTEMVSAKAILYNNKKTWELFDIKGETPPVGVQIFGSEPEEMARAAQIVEENGASIIDINMGCPTPKIVKNSEGAALMLDEKKALKIVEAVVNCVSVPVTVKMRKGWDKNSVNCVELAKRVEEKGAKAVTIHGRTREQFYSGSADWEIIKKVVENVDIPVIGNGDIVDGKTAQKMLQETNCKGIMIGRGSMGNPWIFKEVLEFLQSGKTLKKPTLEERINLIKKHLELVVSFKGEKVGVREMRKHIAWYLKGLKNSAKVKVEVFQAEKKEEIESILEKYLLSQQI